MHSRTQTRTGEDMSQELTAKQKEIENYELKFIRGDGEVIKPITITIGAIFELYAKILGYTRPPNQTTEELVKKFREEFEDEYPYDGCLKTALMEPIEHWLRENLPVESLDEKKLTEFLREIRKNNPILKHDMATYAKAIVTRFAPRKELK